MSSCVLIFLCLCYYDFDLLYISKEVNGHIHQVKEINDGGKVDNPWSSTVVIYCRTQDSDLRCGKMIPIIQLDDIHNVCILSMLHLHFYCATHVSH